MLALTTVSHERNAPNLRLILCLTFFPPKTFLWPVCIPCALCVIKNWFFSVLIAWKWDFFPLTAATPRKTCFDGNKMLLNTPWPLSHPQQQPLSKTPECQVTEKEAFTPFLPTFRVLASQFVDEIEVKDRKCAADCGVLDNLWATISFWALFLGKIAACMVLNERLTLRHCLAVMKT